MNIWNILFISISVLGCLGVVPDQNAYKHQILSVWMDRICSHPILCTSEILLDFITCKDDKQWKKKKRDHEKAKGKYAPISFMYSVSFDRINFDTIRPQLKQSASTMDGYIDDLSKSTKALIVNAENYHRAMRTQSARLFTQMSQSLSNYSKSLKIEPTNVHDSLSKSIAKTSEIYNEIGKQQNAPVTQDCLQFFDMLHDQVNLYSALPTLMGLNRASHRAMRLANSALDERNVIESEAMSINTAASKVSAVIQAEFNWLNKNRDEEISHSVQTYLQDQINYYQNITDQLKAALSSFKQT